MADVVRVVIVDDSKDATDILSLMLEMDGYQVESAHDGVQALTLIEKCQPHCVLLDVHMPEMNGFELAKKLRETYQDGMVLIAVTGAPKDDAFVSKTFGLVDHYFTKPVDPNRLRKLLQPVT